MTSTRIYSIYHARGPHAGYNATVLIQTDEQGVCDVKNFGTVSAFDAAQIVRWFTLDEVTVAHLSGTAFKQLHGAIYKGLFPDARLP